MVVATVFIAATLVATVFVLLVVLIVLTVLVVVAVIAVVVLVVVFHKILLIIPTKNNTNPPQSMPFPHLSTNAFLWYVQYDCAHLRQNLSKNSSFGGAQQFWMD